jgi:hypothetical protein
MNDLSDKAKIIYVVLKKLGAIDKEHKTTSYSILDYIVEESESLQQEEELKNIPEQDFIDFSLDVNIKSINTLISALTRKNLVEKTLPTSITIEGTSRNLRQYYLK